MADKFQRPPVELIDAFKDRAGEWFLELWKYLQDLSAGGGGGYTTLAEFVDETAHRMFYSNASGDVQSLAHGTSGKILTSNGGGSAPSWQDSPHYTNLTEFIAQNAWRLFYSNASGDVQETGSFSGESGKYLKSNGAAAPTWDTPTTSNPDKAHLGKTTATENIATGSSVAIAWDAQDRLDTDSFTHSTSTNNSRLTVDATGRYQIIANIYASHNTDPGDSRGYTAWIRKNGSGGFYGGGTAAFQTTVPYDEGGQHVSLKIVTEIQLTANDYIELMVDSDTESASSSCTTTAAWCEMIVTKIE